MKILIIGGMHGNEPLGVGLVKKLQDEPIDGISAVIANNKAVEENVRFISNDLNRSFAGDNNFPYESRRAKELLDLCMGYDVVLDFHNTYCPDNNCSFVGQTAPESLYDVSNQLGLKRIIVADYDCINKYASNCLSVEISMNSIENDIDNWYEKIKNLQKFSKPPEAKDLQLYKFVYRMTIEDRDRLKLNQVQLKAFSVLDEGIANKLGVTSPAYPIFIADSFTPYNYGGLLNRIK